MKLTAYDTRQATPGAAMASVRQARLGQQPISTTRDSIADLTLRCIESAGGVSALARRIGTSDRSVRNWRDGVYTPSTNFLAAMAEMMGEVAPRTRQVTRPPGRPPQLKEYVERGVEIAGSYRRLSAALGMYGAAPSRWARGDGGPSPAKWDALKRYVDGGAV